MTVSSFRKFKVFISHAGEDKLPMAIPLREQLDRREIKAFVDEKDMPGGTWSQEAMITAMETVDIAVVILSPEFVARKWPMKELLCFLRRVKTPTSEGRLLPIIIPLFYRLKIKQLFDEPRLDSRNSEGKEIYKESRFFERKQLDEPEANIANIKAALRKLHDVMGVENFVDATNASTTEMEKRRNALLNEMCKQVEDAAKRITEMKPVLPKVKPEGDQYRPDFATYDEIAELILDFMEEEQDPSVRSFESTVFHALMDRSNTTVLSIEGIAGVGKTSVMGGLTGEETLQHRFKDGIFFATLGSDAHQSNMTKLLCDLVKQTGGEGQVLEIRKHREFAQMFEVLGDWFRGKTCLFMIDDLWDNTESSFIFINGLLKLHETGADSKVLISTRSGKVGVRAQKRFLLEPRDPQDPQCRKILMLQSGCEVEETDTEKNLIVEDILKRCAGLPLFVKIAGRSVKSLSNRPDVKKDTAFLLYAKTLEESMQTMINFKVDSYERLASTLSVSVKLLECRTSQWGFYVGLTVAQMHRRLQVMTSQARVPMTMLRHLWQLESTAESAIVARELEQIGLGSMHAMSLEAREDYREVFGVHDSLFEYAVGETREHKEEKLGHEVLLDGYGNGLEVLENGFRVWW